MQTFILQTGFLNIVSWWQELLPTLNRKKMKLRDRLRPRRIILVRHGQSEGNKDPHAYDSRA